MFARAAIVGRVARERSEARRHFQQQKQELKKKAPQAPFKQRCFIPVVRGPCLTIGSGFFLILIGAIMCNFAFHAEKLSIVTVNTESRNTTSEEVIINISKKNALKSLTFVGPGLMGLGIFIIIIACVLLFDERDKILKEYVDSVIRNQQELSMELSLHAVSGGAINKPLKRMKKTSSAYLELDETKLCDTKVACALSLSSAPCLQTYKSEMEDIEEMPNGQNIELGIFNEQNCDQSEAESETEDVTGEEKLSVGVDENCIMLTDRNKDTIE